MKRYRQQASFEARLHRVSFFLDDPIDIIVRPTFRCHLWPRNLACLREPVVRFLRQDRYRHSPAWRDAATPQLYSDFASGTLNELWLGGFGHVALYHRR